MFSIKLRKRKNLTQIAGDDKNCASDEENSLHISGMASSLSKPQSKSRDNNNKVSVVKSTSLAVAGLIIAVFILFNVASPFMANRDLSSSITNSHVPMGSKTSDVDTNVFFKNVNTIMENGNTLLVGTDSFPRAGEIKALSLSSPLMSSSSSLSSQLSSKVYYPYFDIQDVINPFEEVIEIQRINFMNMDDVNATEKFSSAKKEKRLNASNGPNEHNEPNDHVILTRRGYKGGPVNSQTNQDRAIIISPFLLGEPKLKLLSSVSSSMLIGIFDGHGEEGHLVAHFVQQFLPIVLESHLLSHEGHFLMSKEIERNDAFVKQALMKSFQIVDREMPSSIGSGAGCTASIILQIDPTILYAANVGDSQSFIFAYMKSTQRVEIVYETKKHKGHDPKERERIEKMGGQIEIPPFTERQFNGQTIEISSRVIIPDTPIGPVSLAMSRSMGDHDGKNVGIIAEPTIDVLNIPSLIRKAKNQHDNRMNNNDAYNKNDVELFAVAASDGLLDFIKPIGVAQRIANAINNGNDNGNTSTLLKACEDLILKSSKSWLALRYRDDITIALSKIET